jgi:di/tricarboxylate transporter
VITLPWFYQYISILVFLGIIIASVVGVELKVSCFVAAISVVVLQLMSSKELAKSLPIEIFLLIGFSFPLGVGMQRCGLAEVFEDLMADAGVKGFPLLLVIGLLAIVMTNTITNQGSVQVLFPLVLHVYQAAGEDPTPGIVMLASCLCCGLLTPFAIPPNAIIITPGGYRAKDFIKFGVILSILYWLLAAVLVAAIYNSW